MLLLNFPAKSFKGGRFVQAENKMPSLHSNEDQTPSLFLLETGWRFVSPEDKMPSLFLLKTGRCFVSPTYHTPSLDKTPSLVLKMKHPPLSYQKPDGVLSVKQRQKALLSSEDKMSSLFLLE